MLHHSRSAGSQQAAAFFCNTINHGDYHRPHFAVDSVSGAVRVILNGRIQEVVRLIDSYQQAGPYTISGRA